MTMYSRPALFITEGKGSEQLNEKCPGEWLHVLICFLCSVVSNAKEKNAGMNGDTSVNPLIVIRAIYLLSSEALLKCF